MNDADAMRRALDLAANGWARVHPNPLVGAVVLADGAIVGEGFHGEFGGPHAEAVALAAAGERARGGTLFVTLEPCRHLGKQPSCADAVVAAGIRRVVVAMPDPDPVGGGGVNRLRQAGVEVDVGCEREAAERLNAAYLRNRTGATRPFVALKLATTLDHKIADAAGHSRWISGEEARDWVHWFRAGFQAIGVGGRTAQIDDPMLTARGRPEPRVRPARVVFLGHRRLGPDATLIRTAAEARTILVSDVLTGGETASLEERGITVIADGDLATQFAALRSAGIDSMVVEGGGRLGRLVAGRRSGRPIRADHQPGLAG
ncbi:MAG: bifunctional diaminohydroxyphosphoribosylaminopyrimidine deaminase/5-amino-6-(5-phosphoribosylamino)uracil reductase RibD [Gemmatimonadales bacterium]